MKHIPVMIREVLKYLPVDPDGITLDMTGGGGGHSAAMLEKISLKGRLVILDRDLDAVARLKERFKGTPNVTIAHSNFSDFDRVLGELGISSVTSVLADFGVSLYHLKVAERGFSFRSEGPLDMRMNQDDTLSAADVVNSYSRENLSSIIKKYGEENFAWNIAGAIERAREVEKIETTTRLAEIVASAVPRKAQKPGINPATKTFQALRIFVNSELDSIEEMLGKLENYVDEGGRVAFISFHSLEDRIVKDAFREFEKECVCPPELPVCNCSKVRTFRQITRKPLEPREDELEMNPLSRSAKMRVAERV
ncbi:S-adenosyl-methyltransferase MraW [Denitrovibrio acetiphilus DSM 12809]|uniref:Ribosomal RNA small subunit methyltransferase H n=1 Tax=Denitrovibrio acetiphilus (strain DSM 12809 / NBRC 114555 / N2460) TaxID=522772 RepID=D4H2U8_DENA2|nr:16S rRNA (cytosine(1402)-N(4))-methyltransferase RsmH [Denitrovibrio acetiphilus]ADD68971.1 S-adenosyl-methyltransferase MraW [Denitrovibrio acetiphilus DSM 12809]